MCVARTAALPGVKFAIHILINTHMRIFNELRLPAISKLRTYICRSLARSLSRGNTFIVTQLAEPFLMFVLLSRHLQLAM